MENIGKFLENVEKCEKILGHFFSGAGKSTLMSALAYRNMRKYLVVVVVFVVKM